MNLRNETPDGKIQKSFPLMQIKVQPISYKHTHPYFSCRSRYSLWDLHFLSCRSPLIHFLFMFPLISPHADQGTSYFTAECHLMPFSHVDLKETLKETHKETQEMGETTPSNTTIMDSLTCTLVCHLLSISHLDLRMRSNIKIVRVSFAKET